MKLKSILFIIISLTSLQAFAQDDEPAEVKKSNKAVPRIANPYFPFSMGDTSTEYDLYIDTQDPKIMSKYSPMFKRHGLSYTVNVWEDLLQQLLKQMNDTVAAAVVTNVDGEILRIGTENKSHRAKFLDWMHEMFTNNKRFDAFLKAEDPTVSPIPAKKKKEGEEE